MGEHRDRGFTLVELMIVIAVVGVLGAIASVAYRGHLQASRRQQAISDLRTIDLAIAVYQGGTMELPASLADVDMDGLRDPWGNPYHYNNFDLIPPGARRKDKNLVPINSTYDLWSNGPDGLTAPALTAAKSHDDLIRANDGAFLGVAADY